MSSIEKHHFGLLSTETVYSGKVVHLTVDRVRLPNGEVAELEMIRHPGAAVALPVVAAGDGSWDALLVRQYRYAADGWLLEAPGGKLDGPGEDPEACVRRELEEEIGYRAAGLEPLGWIWTTPGFIDERIWLYLARDPQPLPHGASLEEHEVIELERIPLHQAVRRAAAGEITDSKTVVTILRAASLLGVPL